MKALEKRIFLVCISDKGQNIVIAAATTTKPFGPKTPYIWWYPKQSLLILFQFLTC